MIFNTVGKRALDYLQDYAQYPGKQRKKCTQDLSNHVEFKLQTGPAVAPINTEANNPKRDSTPGRNFG